MFSQKCPTRRDLKSKTHFFGGGKLYMNIQTKFTFAFLQRHFNLKCISKIKSFYSYLNKWVPGILKHKMAYQNAGLTNSISHGTAFFSGNFSASIVLSLTETDGGWAYFLLCLSITRYLIHNIHTILHSPEIHNASS